jgi:hypothetical protein
LNPKRSSIIQMRLSSSSWPNNPSHRCDSYATQALMATWCIRVPDSDARLSHPTSSVGFSSSVRLSKVKTFWTSGRPFVNTTGCSSHSLASQCPWNVRRSKHFLLILLVAPSRCIWLSAVESFWVLESMKFFKVRSALSTPVH